MIALSGSKKHAVASQGSKVECFSRQSKQAPDQFCCALMGLTSLVFVFVHQVASCVIFARLVNKHSTERKQHAPRS